MRNRKFKVIIRPYDLNLLEDFLTCIPLCKTHNPITSKLSQYQMESMYLLCKDCKKVHDKWKRSADRIYSQLCKQYYK